MTVQSSQHGLRLPSPGALRIPIQLSVLTVPPVKDGRYHPPPCRSVRCHYSSVSRKGDSRSVRQVAGPGCMNNVALATLAVAGGVVFVLALLIYDAWRARETLRVERVLRERDAALQRINLENR